MNRRQSKRAIARLIRFARPRYSPALSQRLQGRNVMDGALSRAQAHAWKQAEREYQSDYAYDLQTLAELCDYIDSVHPHHYL